MYSKCTDIYWHLGLSYKASVSILDSAKCVTACLLMIQGPAASGLTLNLKNPLEFLQKIRKMDLNQDCLQDTLFSFP